jgi:hypothetical protein
MKSVHKYLYLFLIHVLLLASCNTTDNFKKKNGGAATREFNQLKYVYGFLKDKFENLMRSLLGIILLYLILTAQ